MSDTEEKTVKKTKTAIAREKWFDAGHTIPPCVNGGCERCVEVRSWSIGGVPSAPAPARLVPA